MKTLNRELGQILEDNDVDSDSQDIIIEVMNLIKKGRTENEIKRRTYEYIKGKAIKENDH